MSGSGSGNGRADWPDMDKVTDKVLRDILLLAGRDIGLRVIAQWSPRERLTACEWAALEHLSASDSPVKRVPEPWLVKVAAGAGLTEQGSEWEGWLVSLLNEPEGVDERHLKTLNLAKRMFDGLQAHVAAARAELEAGLRQAAPAALASLGYPALAAERPELSEAADHLVSLEAHGALAGVAEVLRERSRQVVEKGHTVEHDDEHEGLELIAEASNRLASVGDDAGWPEYEKAYREAGALLAAEIDRLGRMLGGARS